MSQVTENPKGGCVLAGINSVLGAIDRVCPIYHSGPGCCMQTTAADQGQSGHKSSRFVSFVSLPSTNMLEKEVVFGGTEKLRTTVQGAIDIIDADAYFVLTGCTAGIIGDDIVSVTEEFQDKGYSVYPIETPGFVGDSNLGYETVWTTMINQVIEEDVPKDDKLVNIFGIIPYHDPFWSGALEEIDRILSALGLKVNTFFTKHQGIETIRKCSGAALNIIINPWLFKGPAKKMEQKFGIPSIRVPGLFVGATDTTKFVRQVAEAMHLDQEIVDKVIAAEEEYVYDYLAQSVGVVSWKRFAVVADANNAVGITRYLANDFSFTPVLVIVSEPLFRQEDKDRIVAQIEDLEYAKPPKVIFASDQYEINQALREEEEEITLLIGSSNEREVALEKDIQFILAAFPMNERLVFNRTYAGYRGSLTFTEDLYDNL
ncbi:nitrogenase molybdenum-iron protein, alpha and beta chain [Clostridium sp. OM05-6BH]|jgi:nitrogenase molybdenum-iron protein beta chain|uniref:nitrogenase component 1 n=1 Tax=unclassified Clostridium TaxID=2614128 RepID=UPI000E480ACE|nr:MULTISPECIES: nitrogenase component 1 [unclassified Clostridium]RHQ10254.1 nitrogenase molybdenum-iron protein, alpha and beta chain [Clostridium sp. AM49-4BH]RHV16215.1 nitrogenase molybdenum-iron protein, alpha and beta chain [Clostridium sp. OM05-9BH]RHV19333.1 nitrogenase molybdenum-iron protein, alpha and beta chain [Clostridium sp. OM05-6BH]